MNILLAGLGRSNTSLRKHLEAEGHQIHTYDDKREADYNYQSLKREMPAFDLAYLSPGLYYNKAAYKLIKLLSLKTSNELSYSLGKIAGGVKIIAITGSNGKTSTAIFLQYLLKKEGYKVLLAGNIGVPLVEYLDDIDSYDIIILEISSFQAQELADATFSILVITSISPNHLDAYHSVTEYYAAKKRLILLSKSAVFDKRVKKELCLSQKSDIIDYISSTKSMALNYNLALNVIKQLEIDPNKYLSFDYSSLLPPSRYSPFYVFDNLEFIDDSKSTSYAATLSALRNSSLPTYLILGGHMKSYFKPFDKEVRVLVYGREKEKFMRIVGGMGFASLLEVVNYLKKELDPRIKTRILFSPGGASIDYPNYLIRGREFKQMVRKVYDPQK